VDTYLGLKPYLRAQMGCGRQIPGQELADAVDRVVGNSRQDGAKVERRINPVELGRSNQGIERSGALASGIGSKKQIVFPAKSHSAERSFGRAVVDLQKAVVDIARKSAPARENVSDCAVGITLA